MRVVYLIDEASEAEADWQLTGCRPNGSNGKRDIGLVSVCHF